MWVLFFLLNAPFCLCALCTQAPHILRQSCQLLLLRQTLVRNMLYVPSMRPAAIRAMRAKSQMARPETLPFDPEDLVRRLDIVLAEQHLQELQSGKKSSQNQDSSDSLKIGRRLKLRGRKNAAATTTNKDTQSQPQLEQQQSNSSSSQGELRKSIKWSFRAKRVSSLRQSDDECASAIPQKAYTAHDSTASLPQAQSQRNLGQKHHGPLHKDQNTVVLDWKHIDDVGNERAGDGKNNGPSDWSQTDAIDSRSRGLQLLKRISSISTLRARFGGETSEGEASRTQVASIPERGPISHRRSSLLLRLRR